MLSSGLPNRRLASLKPGGKRVESFDRAFSSFWSVGQPGRPRRHTGDGIEIRHAALNSAPVTRSCSSTTFMPPSRQPYITTAMVTTMSDEDLELRLRELAGGEETNDGAE